MLPKEEVLLDTKGDLDMLPKEEALFDTKDDLDMLPKEVELKDTRALLEYDTSPLILGVVLPIDSVNAGELDGDADCVRDVLWEADPLTDGLFDSDLVPNPVKDAILTVADPVLERNEVIVWVIVRISERVPVEVTEAVAVVEPLIVLDVRGDLERKEDPEGVRDSKGRRLRLLVALAVLDTLLLAETVLVNLPVLVPSTLFDTDTVAVLVFDIWEAVFDILILDEADCLAELV